ncbi:MAG: NGG1p interacting factor NIF3 [Candidatus Omnitrophota bacterium]
MKLSQFYKLAIEFGKKQDPRKEKSRIKSFPDSSILFGGLDSEVSKILVGIDIEVGELLLADAIRQREGLDLVVAHHPEGRSYALLHEVMQLQVDVLKKAGLSTTVAEELLGERMREVERRVLAQNHRRPVDAARILGMPFMCLHTPADNHAFQFISNLMETEKPKRVSDIIDLLKVIPEYKEAEKVSAGARIILGNPRRPAGRVLVEMTGGTEGPKDVFDKLYKAGVRTLVSMHLSEEHFKKVKDANLNVVIAGHISSDTLGLNLLLDNIERKAGEKFKVVDCSGFTRFSRH